MIPILEVFLNQFGLFPMEPCTSVRLPGPSLVQAESLGPKECRDEGDPPAAEDFARSRCEFDGVLW